MTTALKINDDGWRAPARQPVERHGAIRDWIEAGTHFRVDGAGPAVMLVHGVGLDLFMWDAVAALLASDYTVIRHDMLGHGSSAKPPGARILGDFVRQLDALHDYLELDRAAIVGFSMGALVAQAFALEHPDKVARLVLMNGVYDRSAKARDAVRARLAQVTADGPASTIAPALERWFTEDFRRERPDVIAAVKARLEANDPHGFLAAYAVFAEADADLVGRLGGIDCPTLVMTAAGDTGSTPAMTAAMATAIPGARAAVLQGLRHMAPVEDSPTVCDILTAFLAGRDHAALT